MQFIFPSMQGTAREGILHFEKGVRTIQSSQSNPIGKVELHVTAHNLHGYALAAPKAQDKDFRVFQSANS